MSVHATSRQDAGDTAGGTPALRNDRMVLADWNSELGSWQRVKSDGFSVEAVCAQLGITRWKLTQLTKEYCNLTATELFDGYKVNQLKTFMLVRLREAAFALWKNPGEYAQYKAQGYLDCQSAARAWGIAAWPAGRRRYSRQDAGATNDRATIARPKAINVFSNEAAGIVHRREMGGERTAHDGAD